MRSRIGNTLIVVGVMCCYFAALTPLHALWHWQEETTNSQKANQNHHNDSETCYYCNLLVSGANSHLVSGFSLEFVSKVFFVHKENIFENKLYNPSFYAVYFSLRAPPIF